MSVENVPRDHPSGKFWVISALLIIVFLGGGSQRPDVQSLQFLRPVAMLAAAYGLITMTSEHWRQYRYLAFLLAAVLALVIAHLIPLPPEIWRALPGRQIVVGIDDLIGLHDAWRPFSMGPVGTMNALYSLSIPVAVFVLATQLDRQDNVRLLGLVIVLAIVSGTIGLLQTIGVKIQLYALSSENAGLFANRNHQGILLAMLFPMLAVAAAHCEVLGLPKRLGTIVAGALALIAIPLIIVTGSRAGLIAAILAVFLVPFLGFQSVHSRKRGNPGLSAGKILSALAMIGALVWLTVMASRDTALNRFGTLEEDIRYPVWKSIVDMLPTYLPWGSGVGSYADAYQIHEPDILLRPTFSNHAHNEWLEIALTAGLPGLAILAAVVVLLAYAAWHALRWQGMHGMFIRLGLVLILLLAFGSSLDYPVRTPIMSSVLVIAAVWASSLTKFGNSDARG